MNDTHNLYDATVIKYCKAISCYNTYITTSMKVEGDLVAEASTPSVKQ